MRTLGICASDSISLRQRTPVPMQPTLRRSLAPRTLAAGAAKAAAPAAEAFRKERRETVERVDMGGSPRGGRPGGTLDASTRHGQYRDAGFAPARSFLFLWRRTDDALLRMGPARRVPRGGKRRGPG